MREHYQLSITTQGPLYPPSEIMNEDGQFIVIGRIPDSDGNLPWAGAIVSQETVAPTFGQKGVYKVIQELDINDLQSAANQVLYTLPLPLPANNYPMLFAPEQRAQAHSDCRPSYPLHAAPIPDLRTNDGRREIKPITLGDWVKATGEVTVTVAEDQKSALFEFSFKNLIPNSLYTVMSLRQKDLDPIAPTRPGPLGIPNVFVTDDKGDANYWAKLPNPFPDPNLANANRIINVIVLFMSSQISHGGAIGLYGLGGDIHAQLKLKEPSFTSLQTVA